MSTGFPWARLMEIGLGNMRLPSERFWAMTLPEISALARALNPRSALPPQRGDIDALMQLYPDKDT